VGDQQAPYRRPQWCKVASTEQDVSIFAGSETGEPQLFPNGAPQGRRDRLAPYAQTISRASVALKREITRQQQRPAEGPRAARVQLLSETERVRPAAAGPKACRIDQDVERHAEQPLRYTRFHAQSPSARSAGMTITTTATEPLHRPETPHAHDVTVVVPTLNRGILLRKTLSTLTAQTVRCRIVVVDDASTDETADVCAAFAERVDYVRNERRLGLFANWNRGLELVETEFAAVYHDDDLYHPQAVASEEQLLRRHPDMVMAHSGCLVIDDDDEPLDSYIARWPAVMSGASFRHVLAGRFSSPVAAPSVMLRTEAIRSIGGFDERLRVSGDLAAWVALANLGTVGYVPRPLVAIRRRGRYANEHARFDWRVIDEHLRVARETHEDVLGLAGIRFQARVDWYLAQFLLREVERSSDGGGADVVRRHGSLVAKGLMRVAPHLPLFRPVLAAARPVARRALEGAGRIRRARFHAGWTDLQSAAGARRRADTAWADWPVELSGESARGDVEAGNHAIGEMER
jgi:glycosyltransferase involved in cell wall biosynthesis